MPNGAIVKAAVAGALCLLALTLALPAAVAQAATIDGNAVQPHVYQGGGVIGFGDAQYINAPIGTALNSVMVAMAVDPASTAGHQGYWLAAADGGVFAQGDAGYYGSAGGITLNAPVVGIAATPDGKGYWLVAIDGGVFT